MQANIINEIFLIKCIKYYMKMGILLINSIFKSIHFDCALNSETRYKDNLIWNLICIYDLHTPL